MSLKRKFALASFIALCATTALGATVGTIAWFNDKVTIQEGSDLTGTTLGAYFAYGDGSSSEGLNPYGITKPRHLYNLAWLQYLGNYFKEGNTYKQYYFKLDADLDMTGYVLPPIGTREHPFIGFFDGNKHIISNLTVSNDFSDYDGKPKPADVTSINNAEHNAEIIGFFGVIGEIKGDKYDTVNKVPEVKNFGLENITIKSGTTQSLMGVAAGYVNGKVSSVAVGTSELDISTSTTTAITEFTNNISDYGTVGYAKPTYRSRTSVTDVKAFQPNVENGVASSAANLYGASIPMKTIYTRLLGLKQAARTNSNLTKYYQTKNEFYDLEGNLEKTEYSNEGTVNVLDSGQAVENYEADSTGKQISSYTFYDRGSSADNFMYLYGQKSKNVTQTVNEYRYSNIQTQKIGVGDKFLAYANGQLSATSENEANGWIIDNDTGFIYIIENDQPLYLRASEGPLTTTASESQATVWYYSDSETSLYTEDGLTLALENDAWVCRSGLFELTYLISYGNNYLRFTSFVNNATGTSGTESQATPFTYDGTYYKYGNLYLSGKYNNGDTTGVSLTSSTTYALRRSGQKLYYEEEDWWGDTYKYYLRYRYKAWSISTSDNYNILTFTRNPVTITSPNSQLVFVDTTEKWRTVSNTYDSTIQATSRPTYFPLTYTNSDTTSAGKNMGQDIAFANTGYIISGSNYATQPGDMRVSKYALLQKPTDDYGRTLYRYNLGRSFADNQDQTSYPNSDATNLGFDVVTRNKDGEFVRIKDDYNKTNTSTNNNLPSSKVWYGKTDPSSSSSATLNLKRYKAAREGFHNTMKGQSYVYGLHFMDAQISKSRTVEVEKAIVNGKLYQNNKEYELILQKDENNNYKRDTNGNLLFDIGEGVDVGGKYQFPQDCIDFNLSKMGTINFFAGSYFPGNTAFFSLHQIFRDGSGTNKVAITDIKEIRQVYEKAGYDPLADDPGNKYIYYYKNSNGTYSWSEEKASEDKKVFDLSWITDDANITQYSISNTSTTSRGACFYFEIPLLAGEYALGSVPDHDGAYLMYLDIGAADADTDKTIVTEYTITGINQYDHPAGVDFVEFAVTMVENKKKYVYQSVTGNDSATAVIPTNLTGQISFSFANETLTCGPPKGGAASGKVVASTYAGDGVTVKSAATYGGTTADITPTPVADLSSSTTTERVVTYTYDIDNEKLKVTIEEAVDNGDLKPVGDPTVTAITEAEYEKIRVLVYDEPVEPGDVRYLEFSYYSPGDSTNLSHEYTYVGDPEATENRNKYVYVWTVTSTQEDIVVHVTYIISQSNLVSSINGTALTTVPTDISVAKTPAQSGS